MHPVTRKYAVLVGVALLVAACHRGGPASAAASPSPAAAPAPTAGPSLYQRLGGLDAIRAVVNDFHARLMADARISAFFRGLDDEDLKAKLTDQICEASGGPCHYAGRSMREAHAQLQITNADFDALVSDLVASLEHFDVGAREKTELLAVLGGMRREIVTRR
jgi:hemoglobin